ncbi:hypothetical protein BMH30_11250, partial [Leucobacter sp. OLES1]
LFERELEDDEVDTVGGLLAKHLGRLAEPGDRVEIDGIELTALETERRRQRLVTARVRWVGTEDNDADQVRREEEQQ